MPVLRPRPRCRLACDRLEVPRTGAFAKCRPSIERRNGRPPPSTLSRDDDVPCEELCACGKFRDVTNEQRFGAHATYAVGLVCARSQRLQPLREERRQRESPANPEVCPNVCSCPSFRCSIRRCSSSVRGGPIKQLLSAPDGEQLLRLRIGRGQNGSEAAVRP